MSGTQNNLRSNADESGFSEEVLVMRDDDTAAIGACAEDRQSI